MTAQDVLVTVFALAAAVVIGRRWWKSRTAASGSCASCPSSGSRPPTGRDGEPEVKPLAFMGMAKPHGKARRP